MSDKRSSVWVFEVRNKKGKWLPQFAEVFKKDIEYELKSADWEGMDVRLVRYIRDVA